jgi:hypothetical protein
VIDRLARPAAWLIWSAAVALASAGAGLVLVSLGAPVPDNWGFRGYWDILAPTFATPGLLIARRQPRNSIGWILLLAGVALGFGGFVQEYATRAVIIAPGSLPAAVPLAWIASWSFAIFAFSLLALIPQLFPTGRPLGRTWWPLLWCGVLAVAVAVVLFGLQPGPLENASFIDNPLAVTGSFADLHMALRPVLALFMAATVAASGAALVVRFRRARGVERQQVKWVASSAVLCAIAFVTMLANDSGKVWQIVMIGSSMTMPVAIGVAILRYRLYDIDILINRALVYGATTAGIAIAFFAGIVVLQALLRPITSGSELAVAASTLASVALFQPLRRRIQDTVDRRFYRARYDAARTLDDFSARLRDEVDLDAVRADLVAAVRDSVQPAQAGVWLRDRP